LFDTHAHYDDRKFEKDREDIIYTAHNSGVNYILNVSVDMSSANRSIELANKYNFMYAAIGIHPHEVCKAQKPDIERLYHLAQSNSKVVAIGEIGLDYHYNYSPKQQQIKWFITERHTMILLKLSKTMGHGIVEEFFIVIPEAGKCLEQL
jgi:TatD DNase family protein